MARQRAHERTGSPSGRRPASTSQIVPPPSTSSTRSSPPTRGASRYAAQPARRRRDRLGDEDDIHVADVVEFAPTALAHRDDGEPAGLRVGPRSATAASSRLERRVGEIGQPRRGLFHRRHAIEIVGGDAKQDAPVGHPQRVERGTSGGRRSRLGGPLSAPAVRDLQAASPPGGGPDARPERRSPRGCPAAGDAAHRQRQCIEQQQRDRPARRRTRTAAARSGSAVSLSATSTASSAPPSRPVSSCSAVSGSVKPWRIRRTPTLSPRRGVGALPFRSPWHATQQSRPSSGASTAVDGLGLWTTGLGTARGRAGSRSRS